MRTEDMNDQQFFDWLAEQTDPKVVITEMLRLWDFFCGDGYYRDFHVSFHDKFKQLVSVEA